MQIKQNLNKYTKKYKTEHKWEILESEHYIFNYNLNSKAEEEIEFIIETQEKAYQKITKDLELGDNFNKIKYYLYSSNKQKEELMGDGGNAQVIWYDFSIHIVYNEDIKPIGEHEDTHLLTLGWGVAIGFFQEGLAEYMSGCLWKNSEKKDIDARFFVKELYSKNMDISIDDLFSHSFWNKTIINRYQYYYPLAGLFTKYLFKEFGLEKYRKFYKSINRENPREEIVAIFENIFGNLLEIEKKFIRSFLIM